jgi:predicted GNAT superfamily acetyltransferase
MIVVREAEPEDLVAGTRLLAEVIGFGAADAIPAWLVKDAQEAGAVALVAAAGTEIVGFSVALPALGEDGPYLFSCGLGVAARLRSRGIGRRLKLAQRELALQRGIVTIRWRADPLNAPGLRLYLDGLGARVVGYRAALYDGVRESGPVPHDDVDVEWSLDRPGRPRGLETGRVELPWSPEELAGDRAARSWRSAVREQATEALAAGAFGAGVERDAGAHRAWLRFEARA